jgi:hypothetical protein
LSAKFSLGAVRTPELSRLVETFIRVGEQTDLSPDRHFHLLRTEVAPLVCTLRERKLIGWFSFLVHDEPYLQIADSYWSPQLTFNGHNGHMYFQHDERAAQNSFGKKFVDAVYAARSARFEFGESGGI